VKGFGSTAILRATIRPVRNEEFRDRTPKRSGSHMKRRVTSVKVVSDFGKKEGRCVLACSAKVRRRSGKRGIGRQAAGHLVDLAIPDMSNEIKKDRLHLWHCHGTSRLSIRIGPPCSTIDAKIA
jgi:hypothetical protein